MGHSAALLIVAVDVALSITNTPWQLMFQSSPVRSLPDGTFKNKVLEQVLFLGLVAFKHSPSSCKR
jgi:hypothetical protein